MLTIHGWGYWALWLWEGSYPRGLKWDPYGTNMLSGALSWFAGATLWVTSLSYIRRNYFEVRRNWAASPPALLQNPLKACCKAQRCGACMKGKLQS